MFPDHWIEPTESLSNNFSDLLAEQSPIIKTESNLTQSNDSVFPAAKQVRCLS